MYLDEGNPNSHTCAIDMVFNTLRNLSDIMSDINVSMYQVPSTKSQVPSMMQVREKLNKNN